LASWRGVNVLDKPTLQFPHHHILWKKEEFVMKEKKGGAVEDLIGALNEDLTREYQAIIAYTVYSTGGVWFSLQAYSVLRRRLPYA
jgi:hypothetical protein